VKETGPFLVFVIIFAIPITAIIVSYFTRKLQSQERLRAIEKGVSLPEPLDWRAKDPWERAADLRLGGLICVAVGLGLVALFAGLSWSVPEFPKGVSAVAAIPFLIGVALLYECGTRRRELGPRPIPRVSQPDRV
jgi:hypothetical protein